MRIAVITAMPEETRAIVKALGRARKVRLGRLTVWQGAMAEQEILVTEAGMGFGNAAAAAELLIGNARPDMVISTGFCGGISADLQVGDIVVATALAVVSGDDCDEVPVEIPAACRNFIVRQAAAGLRVFGGLFAGTPVLMQKSRLAELLPPDAHFPVVEMESAAIAIVCVEQGIPLCGIRAVSDPSDEELDFSLDEFCDAQMRIRIFRVLLTVARKPRIIPQLIRLARNSRVAADSLTRAFRQLMAVL